MSAAIWVALVGPVVTLVCRWLSSREHRRTEEMIAEIRRAVGKTDEERR